MNKDLYVSNLKQWHTKKILGIGAFIWMSASATAAIASSPCDYKGNAQKLIANNAQNLSSYQSQDIQSLKEQLLEKTKELEEYKACLFRPSHPQDQAKINELTKQMADLEKNRQELLALAKACKEELTDVKKQKDSLEVSSEALTDYIKTQRALVEEEKQALVAKMLAYEKETELERKNNEKLVEELAVLKDKLSSLDKILTYHESGEDLQDALLDSSMLKFELDETRVQAEQKEQELIVSTLNYLTMAHDHISKLKAKQGMLKHKLNESKTKHSALLSAIDGLESENFRLQQERQHLNEKINSDGETIQQYTAQRHMFANKLMENEETLNAALAFYEGTLADLAEQVLLLQDLLASEEAAKLDMIIEHAYFSLHHNVENDVLQNAVSDSSEAMADTISSHQLAINDYLQQLLTLEEKLAIEESLRSHLESEKEDYINQEQKRQQEAEEHVIALAHITQQLTQYEADLVTSQVAIDKNQRQIEELKEKLASVEAEHLDLKHAYDDLSTKNGNVEQLLLQYEEENSSSKEDIEENLKQIEELKEKLATAESEHHALQHAYDELMTKNDHTGQQLLQNEADLTTSKDDIEEKLKQIDELNEKLAAAERERLSLQQAYDDLMTKNDRTGQTLLQNEADLAASQDDIKEKLKQIDELNEKLANAEREHQSLKQAYDDLMTKNDQAGQLLLQNETDLTASQDDIKEKLKQIDELNEKLSDAKREHVSLQQAYDDLMTKNDHTGQKLLQNEQDLTASKDDIEDKLKLIDEINEKLANAEKEHLSLQQAYNDLMTKNDHTGQQLLQNEEDLTTSKNDIEEKLKLIDELNEKLADAEREHLSLKRAYDDLMTKNDHNGQQLLQNEADLTASKDNIEEKLKLIDELKEKLADAEKEHHSLKQTYENLMTKHDHAGQLLLQNEEDLTASKDNIEEKLKLIDELNEKLATAEAGHLSLEQTYNTLSAKNSKNEQQLLQYEEDLISSRVSIDEHQKQIKALQERLTVAEADHLFLKQAHDELSTKHSNKEHQLWQHQEDLSSSQNTIAEHLKQIEALQEKLSATETDHHFLKQAHDDQITRNTKHQHQISQYEEELTASRLSIATLQEKLASAEVDHLLLEQAHDDLTTKHTQNNHQLAHYENDLSSAKNYITEHLKHIDGLKEKLLAAEAMQLSLKQTHEELTAAKNHEIRQSHENLASANEQLNQLVAKLERKEQEFKATTHQMQELQSVKDQLHENLNHSLSNLEKIAKQLDHEQKESIRKNQEWDHYQQEQSSSATQLRNQIQEQMGMIDKLNHDIVDLYASQIDYELKENELENAIRSLTVVAERQDHALAEANSAFSMVQAYNQQLQAENMELKNRINNLEIAERSERRRETATETQQLIPPALFKLFKP